MLVLASLVLLTVYLREDDEGALHAAQRIGLAVLAPFQVAGERVARPFQDAYAYVSDLVDVKAERDALELRVHELEGQVVEYQTARQENERLRDLLDFVDGPALAEFERVTTRVLAQPASAYDQEILVAAGSDDGVAVDAPVVNEDGLVGIVTKVAPGVLQRDAADRPVGRGLGARLRDRGEGHRAAGAERRLRAACSTGSARIRSCGWATP